MASESFSLTVTKDSESEVFRANAWSQVTVLLDSAAAGENRLGFQGNLAPIVPGEPVQFIVGPDTPVRFSTTSAQSVEIGFLVTTLDFLNDIIRVLCNIATR